MCPAQCASLRMQVAMQQTRNAARHVVFSFTLTCTALNGHAMYSNANLVKNVLEKKSQVCSNLILLRAINEVNVRARVVTNSDLAWQLYPLRR